MQLVTQRPLKISESLYFLMFSEGTERDQRHEVTLIIVFGRSLRGDVIMRSSTLKNSKKMSLLRPK